MVIEREMTMKGRSRVKYSEMQCRILLGRENKSHREKSFCS